MSDDDRQNRTRDPDRMEEQEQRDSEHHIRDHEGAQKQCREGRPSPDATTGQRDRGEHAEHDGASAGDRRDDRARLQRSLQVAVGEELVVPVKRESAQRERRQLGVVEREDQQDRDREIEEEDDEHEQRPQRDPSVPRERDVHQRAVTCRGWRKRAKTRVSTVTTPKRKIASTEPVSQSGNPVPKRSTIWLPYM